MLLAPCSLGSKGRLARANMSERGTEEDFPVETVYGVAIWV